MALKVTKGPDGWADDPAERCCICRTSTRYWHASDVALCPDCAKTTRRADLPTKQEWCAKEIALAKKARYAS